MAVYIVRTRGKDTRVSLSDSDYVAAGGERRRSIEKEKLRIAFITNQRT